MSTIDLRQLSKEIRDMLLGDKLSGTELLDQAEEVESDGDDILLKFAGDVVVRLSLEED